MKLNIRRFLLYIIIGIISVIFAFNCMQGAFSISDAKSNKTVNYSYDYLGRIIKTEYDDGTVISYTYDKNGNIKSVEVEPSETNIENNPDPESRSEASTQGENTTYDEATTQVEDTTEESTSTENESKSETQNDRITKEETGTEAKTEIHKETELITETDSHSETDEEKNTENEPATYIVPIYTTDELATMNAFKRSKPIIRSLKKSSKKEKRYITVRIGRIKENNTLKSICFQIKYSKNKNFKRNKTVTVNQSNNKNVTSKRFEASKNKTYYVKVRAYVKNKAGKKIYSKYSKIKKISL